VRRVRRFLFACPNRIFEEKENNVTIAFWQRRPINFPETERKLEMALLDAPGHRAADGALVSHVGRLRAYVSASARQLTR
jgi:hypothetical protein